jgi:hypothetical protein
MCNILKNLADHSFQITPEEERDGKSIDDRLGWV